MRSFSDALDGRHEEALRTGADFPPKCGMSAMSVLGISVTITQRLII